MTNSYACSKIGNEEKHGVGLECLRGRVDVRDAVMSFEEFMDELEEFMDESWMRSQSCILTGPWMSLVHSPVHMKLDKIK